MIETWEYKYVEAECQRYYDTLTEIYLQPLGQQGWEVIHITERKCGSGSGETVSLKAYLKRRVMLNDGTRAT